MTNLAKLGPSPLLLLILLGTQAGCDEEASSCVQSIAPGCAPLYEPVFEQIFARSIKPGCAIEGSPCHSGTSARAGLQMDDIDMTYDLLVPGRVLSGDPGCSLLVKRLHGVGGLMPPGAPLSDAERCAIETWIVNGAQR